MLREKIGPFTVRRLLGKGGMGSVYLADHPDMGSRAIKLLAPELLEDARAYQRFCLEVKALALVEDHPGIVRIHSASRTEEGHPYYVMEYVEGRTLKEARRELGLERCLDVMEQLADALAHAHQHKLIHRDVKPDNVMVTNAGDVRLTDFGLTKVVGTQADRLTRSADLVGTPVYMAPEQADSTRGEVGPWTDVYGLGGVLYWLLTTRPPQLGETMVEVLTKLLNEPAEPPSRYRPDLDPGVEAVCLRALARRPRDRYQNASEFRDALRDARAGLHVAPAPGPRSSRLVPVLGVLAGLAVLLALAAVILRLSERAGGAQTASIPGQIDHAFAMGDYGEARALLETLPDPAAHPHAAWILALTGDFPRALGALPADASSERRARLAALAGDGSAFADALAALSAVEPHRAQALSWELWRAARADAPRSEPSDDPRGLWEVLARAEADLDQGLVPLAALGFHAALASPEEADGARLQAHLGLVRVSLARGSLTEARQHLERAQKAAAHPLDTLRCRTWTELLDLAEAPAAPCEAEAQVLVMDERRALARGEHGPAGLLAARGIELATAAERGNSSAAAAEALLLLDLARGLLPASPAVELARSQALRVSGRAPEALVAAEHAWQLSGDGEAHLARARALDASLDPARLEADLARAAGDQLPDLDAELVAALEGVAAAYLDARATSIRLEVPSRLGVARTRLERAWRRGDAALLLRNVTQDLEPILDPCPPSRVVLLRERLVDAVDDADAVARRAAEDELSDYAELPLDTQEALLLQASAGDPKAAAAYLALAGDLPARAILTGLNGGGEGLRRATRLGPRVAELLAADARLRLQEDAGDARAALQLACALGQAPELAQTFVDLLAEVLGFGVDGAALLAERVEDTPQVAAGERALALALVWAVVADRAGPCRRACRAANAALEEGLLAGHLLRTLALRAQEDPGGALNHDLVFDETCAQAALPGAVPVGGADADPRLEAAWRLGDRSTRLADAEEVPVAAATVELLETAWPEGAFQCDLLQASAIWRRAQRTRLGMERLGQAALRGLSRATPPGVSLLEVAARRMPVSGLDGQLDVRAARQARVRVERGELGLLHLSRALVLLEREELGGVSEEARKPLFPVDDLLAPWRRPRCLMLTVTDPITQRDLVPWLLRNSAFREAVLACERSWAFDSVRDEGSLIHVVLWELRQRALQVMARHGYSDWGINTARLMLLRIMGSAGAPERLEGVVAELELDLAALEDRGSANRAAWLEVAIGRSAWELEGTTPEEQLLAGWRRVRREVLEQDPAAASVALRALRVRLEGHPWGEEPDVLSRYLALEYDPLLGELDAVPEVSEFMASVRRATQD
jgi:predicted Ser/Thr protein kinase